MITTEQILVMLTASRPFSSHSEELCHRWDACQNEQVCQEDLASAALPSRTNGKNIPLQ